MIRRVFVAALFAALLPLASSAQFYTTLAPAKTTPAGVSQAGVYFGFSDGFLTLAGQYRVGAGEKMDLSVRPAVYFLDGGGARFGAVGDIRFLLLGKPEPLDLSLGPTAAFSVGEDVTTFFVGGKVCIGTDLQTSSRLVISLYGSVDLGYEHVSVDLPDSAQGNADEGDFDVHGVIGTLLQFNERVGVPIELDLDDDVGIIGGVTYTLR